MHGSALLIIDVQHALCAEPYQVFEAREVIARINEVARKARAAGAPVIVVQHESQGGVLDFGSTGWQLAQGLEVLAQDVRLRKTASDAFHHTELQAMLQARGARHLIVGGMQSDFCVDTTVRRALALGYPVTLIADGHSTLDNAVLSAAQIRAHHNLTLSGLSSFGARATAVPADQIRI